MCRPVPPSWARGRKPDSVLYALAENNNEGLSKLFFVTLWSVDAPDQFQLRLWRKDNDQYASNQGVFAYWAAMWTR